MDIGDFILTRKVDLSKWIYADRLKPKKGQKVFVCDSDWRGFADFEFPAIWDGKGFIVDWSDGSRSAVGGVSYWRPRKRL